MSKNNDIIDRCEFCGAPNQIVPGALMHGPLGKPYFEAVTVTDHTDSCHWLYEVGETIRLSTWNEGNTAEIRYIDRETGDIYMVISDRSYGSLVRPSSGLMRVAPAPEKDKPTEMETTELFSRGDYIEYTPYSDNDDETCTWVCQVAHVMKPPTGSVTPLNVRYKVIAVNQYHEWQQTNPTIDTISPKEGYITGSTPEVMPEPF